MCPLLAPCHMQSYRDDIREELKEPQDTFTTKEQMAVQEIAADTGKVQEEAPRKEEHRTN